MVSRRLKGKPFRLVKSISARRRGFKTHQGLPGQGADALDAPGGRACWEARRFFDAAGTRQHYPTIYVLDPKGVIRYTEIHGEELEKAVNTLLKEADLN